MAGMQRKSNALNFFHGGKYCFISKYAIKARELPLCAGTGRSCNSGLTYEHKLILLLLWIITLHFKDIKIILTALRLLDLLWYSLSQVILHAKSVENNVQCPMF